MSNVKFMQRLTNTLQNWGSGFTQTAMTGLALNSMNSCCGNSIFGFGCNSYGYGFGYCCAPSFGMGMGITPQMMADPLGLSWLPNPNMYNAQNNAYGNMLAYQYGLNLTAQSNAQIAANMAQQQQLQQGLPKMANAYAGDIDKNQNREAGQAFDKATNELIDTSGEPIKNKSFNILNSYPKSAEEYKSSISNLAKSYAAEIDNTSGNKDQKVTLEEFTKHELSKLKSDATVEQKTEATQKAQTAFNKIDINGDGFADWKELSAAISTFDTDTSQEKSKDGTITSKEYAKWATLLGQQGPNEFDTTVRNSYTQLFGNNQ